MFNFFFKTLDLISMFTLTSDKYFNGLLCAKIILCVTGIDDLEVKVEL